MGTKAKRRGPPHTTHACSWRRELARKLDPVVLSRAEASGWADGLSRAGRHMVFLWCSMEAHQGKPAGLSVSSPAHKDRCLCSTWEPTSHLPPRLPPAVHLLLGFKNDLCPAGKPGAEELLCTRMPADPHPISTGDIPVAPKFLLASQSVPTSNPGGESFSTAVAACWLCRSGRPCTRTRTMHLTSLLQHNTCVSVLIPLPC